MEPKEKHVVHLADVRPEPIDWLWPGHIAAGKLTLIDGDPGVGKSLITLDLAARLTTGREFPDGSACAGRSGLGRQRGRRLGYDRWSLASSARRLESRP